MTKKWEQIVTLLGKPRSTNGAYKTMCRGNFPNRYLSTEARSLKQSYVNQAKEQYTISAHVNPLAVKLDIYHPTRRKNDIDNFSKLAIDSLTGIVWKDDDQIERMIINKKYDKQNPRIEISFKRI